MIHAFVINLVRDSERRLQMQKQLAGIKGVNIVFVQAVDGATLPEQVCAALTDKSWAKNKGTIGCFLSHVRTWELIAALTVPFAVVLEDDIVIDGLDVLYSTTFPEDFEFIFINDRMTVDDSGRHVASMTEALLRVDIGGGGFGTDGYILTPNAARKLLIACEKDGYYGHIDGRLVRYTTSETELGALGDADVGDVIRYHHQPSNMPQLGLLKAYVKGQPLVRQNGIASSRAAIDAGAELDIDSPPQIDLARFNGLVMVDPPALEGVLLILEEPKINKCRAPEFIADFSGRGLRFELPQFQNIHGSYLTQRKEFLLFGPNHLVGDKGYWSCEARTHKEQYLSYLQYNFYNKMWPGLKPQIKYHGLQPTLDMSIFSEHDIERIDTPVFLATPLEPRVWGHWIATVAAKAAQYNQHGEGRKFFCYCALDWQKAFLKLFGIDESMILSHDPGKTYICHDVMTVEYSVTNMTISALERINFFEMVTRHQNRFEKKSKIFVSRLSRSKVNQNYRVLQNEEELAAMLAGLGFEAVEPETLSIEDQISLFSRAEQIVFLGGSGVYNAAFCAPGTRVVTIESTDTYIHVHAGLLASLGLRYGVIFGREDGADTSVSQKRWSIDVARVREQIIPFFADA